MKWIELALREVKTSREVWVQRILSVVIFVLLFCMWLLAVYCL